MRVVKLISSFLLTLSIFFTIFLAGCKKDDSDPFVSEPTFITSDIELFWQTFDKQTSNYSSSEFQSEYINKGTIGLQDYASQKNLAPSLQSVLRSSPYFEYFNEIRENSMDLSETEEKVAKGFELLETIYPETTFLNVYFLVGALTAGGRISENGLLIAVEMFSAPDDFSLENLGEWHQNVIRNKKYLPSIVLHELVHVQQFQHPNSGSVLEASLAEGMADFISHHLISNEPFMNEHLHEYGDGKEEELWNEFKAQVNLNSSNTEWLYTAKTTANGHPADMGYYMGYKILESYSTQFSSINEAIAQMLTTKNYSDIYTKSGYANKFD